MFPKSSLIELEPWKNERFPRHDRKSTVPTFATKYGTSYDEK